MPDTVEKKADVSAKNGRSDRVRSGAVPFSRRRILFPLLLSVLVLVVIGAYTFEPAQLDEIVDRLNPWWLGAALVAVFLKVYLGGLRLAYISRGKIGTAGGVRAQLAWDFFSNVTPSAIGGAPFAALYVARDNRIDVGESTAFLLFSVLLDQLWFALTIPIVLVASFYLEVIPASLGNVGMAGFLLYFVGILAWVVLFGYATLVRPDYLQRLASWIFRFRWLRRFQERVERMMRQLRHRAKILRSQPPEFYIQGFLLTVGTWMSRYLLLVFIVLGFVTNVDSILLLLRTAAMTLGSLLLPTPGGAGGIEGLYALFVGPLIPAALLAPTLLLWRFLAYYLFVGIGVFLSTHHVQKTMRRNAGDVEASGADEAVATVHDALHEEVHP